MIAHKVPATYYSSWKADGKKHSFYVFDKGRTAQKGECKSYKKIKRITQEHAYFVGEDFYYINIKSMPCIAFKLEKEINEFFSIRNYNVVCKDPLAEDENNSIISINSYDDYIRFQEYASQWDISNYSGETISNESFFEDFNSFIFSKVGTLIEKKYFAEELEPKWRVVLQELLNPRCDGENLILNCRSDLLEFFMVLYLRVEGVIEDYIKPVLSVFENNFHNLGYEESELNMMKKYGILAPEPYFYGILLDAARGDKRRIYNHIKGVDEDYKINLLHSNSSIGFITSSMPCVVVHDDNERCSEIIFPASPQYCLDFKKKDGKEGKYYEVSELEVKRINNEILHATKNIVISDVEYIMDRL